MYRYHIFSRVVVLAVLVVLTPYVGHAATTATSTPALTADGIFAYTNAERIKEGLKPLTINTTLSAVAATKMADLFARQYFAHEAPTGEDVSDLAKRAGYEYLVIGENLALGDFTSNRHVVKAWMDSPGHRANILNTAYREIGIAAGRGTYEGRSVWIAVQSFGLPKSSCPAADPALYAKVTQMNKTLTLLGKIAELREQAYKDVKKTDPALKTLVDSYNTAANLYNKKATEYRALATKYNKQVDASNACIKKLTRKVTPQ